jgi:hypothetical protein
MEGPQPTAQNLVAAFAAEDHLDAHRLDLSAKEVHRRACAYRRHVVRLEVVDNLGDRVEALLDREHILVVYGAQEVRGFARGDKVWRVLEPD